MGLDQYLTARRYVGNWDHDSKTDRGRLERQTYAAIMGAIGKPGFRCDGSPHLYVEVSVAYWRKANQIHAWFVEHVQKGEDDCDTYSVGDDQLRELVALCKTVLERSETTAGQVYAGTTYSNGNAEDKFTPGAVVANPSVATELLPTRSGFFFGGTDYDEYYLEDLRNTVKQIETALTQFDGWDFQYHASW